MVHMRRAIFKFPWWAEIDVKLGPFTCSWCKIDWIAVTFVFRDKKKFNFAWWKMLTRDNRLSKHAALCATSRLYMSLMPRRRRRRHRWKTYRGRNYECVIRHHVNGNERFLSARLKHDWNYSDYIAAVLKVFVYFHIYIYIYKPKCENCGCNACVFRRR